MWIDGKPIYQKTFTVTINSTTTTIIHGIQNIGTYRNVDHSNTFAINKNGIYYPYMHIALHDVSNNKEYSFGSVHAITETNFQIYCGSGGYGTAYITIRYTKTTD